MVAGFEKFKEHFGAFQDEFIIIGGTAVQLIRGESDHTRVTRLKWMVQPPLCRCRTSRTRA